MAKHHRKRRKRGTLRPDDVRPLAPEAFRQAVLRTQEAVNNPLPRLQEWEATPVMLRDGDTEEAITLTDTPLLRIMLALEDCFPQPGESLSAFWRLQALESLLEHNALSPWVKPVGEAWQVADAILFVAATAPLNAKGDFLLEPFCAALARWTEEHPEHTQEDEPGG